MPEKGVVAVIVLAFVLLVGTMVAMALVMANVMSDHMGMMARGSSGEAQSPLVATAAVVAVEIRDYTFFPAKLTVNVGTEVVWTNRDPVPHTATSTTAVWDTGRLDEGDSASFAFDTPGQFPYYCVYHPNQKGTVTVR